MGGDCQTAGPNPRYQSSPIFLQFYLLFKPIKFDRKSLKKASLTHNTKSKLIHTRQKSGFQLIKTIIDFHHNLMHVIGFRATSKPRYLFRLATHDVHVKQFGDLRVENA